MNQVEVVVSAFNRPNNIPTILEALRIQSIPVTCTMTNASDYTYRGWDREFKMVPMGAWERMAIAGAYEHEYTMFLDDDVLPPSGFVEWFTGHAAKLGNRFSVLGFKGRLYNFDRIYRVDEPNIPEYCHWLAQVYFFKTADLHWALSERLRCGLTIGTKASHFDALMCYGITRNTGLPCYALPSPPDMDWANLADEHGLSRVDGYEQDLINTIKKIQS